MKKLITGAIAAAALLFGFASCTGLHDNATQPLKITGNLVDDMQGFGEWLDVELVTSDGSEQKYEFTATAGNQFKLSTAGSWATDIAGDDINSVYPVINGDYIDLHSREAEALPNTQNVVINDMTVGEKYVMLIKYNPTTKATSVKITGSAVVMPALDIVVAGESKNFPAKDKDGNDVTYTMKRSGTEYTYQFIASETETVSFHLESATAGLTYGGATLTTSDAALTVYDKTDMSTSLVKDHEYKLTVKVPSLTTATIKAEEVSPIAKAAVKANWIYSDNYFEKDAKAATSWNSKDSKWNDATASVVFQYTQTNDFNFTVNRVAESDTLAWGGVTITPDQDFTALTYNTEGKAEDVKFSGTKDNWYVLQVKANPNDFTVSAKAISAPVETTVYLIGGFGNSHIYKEDGTTATVETDIGWGTPAHTVDLTNAKATIVFTYNGDGWSGSSGELNFKFLNNLTDKLEYCSGDVNVGNEASLILAGSGNATAKGLEIGAKYKMTIESIPAYIKVTISKAE